MVIPRFIFYILVIVFWVDFKRCLNAENQSSFQELSNDLNSRSGHAVTVPAFSTNRFINDKELADLWEHVSLLPPKSYDITTITTYPVSEGSVDISTIHPKYKLSPRSTDSALGPISSSRRAATVRKERWRGTGLSFRVDSVPKAAAPNGILTLDNLGFQLGNAFIYNGSSYEQGITLSESMKVKTIHDLNRSQETPPKRRDLWTFGSLSLESLTFVKAALGMELLTDSILDIPKKVNHDLTSGVPINGYAIRVGELEEYRWFLVSHEQVGEVCAFRTRIDTLLPIIENYAYVNDKTSPLAYGKVMSFNKNGLPVRCESLYQATSQVKARSGIVVLDEIISFSINDIIPIDTFSLDPVPGWAFVNHMDATPKLFDQNGKQIGFNGALVLSDDTKNDWKLTLRFLGLVLVATCLALSILSRLFKAKS